MRRSELYTISGNVLLSIGVIVIVALGMRVMRESVEARVAAQADVLVAEGTLHVALPPLATATPSPTPTHLPDTPTPPPPSPTPSPTPTSTPDQPAIRIAAAKARLNAPVFNYGYTLPETMTKSNQSLRKLLYGAAVHEPSSRWPGQGGNIVLAGHNNTEGAVFRRLPKLRAGDTISLFTPDQEYQYVVRERRIIPYRRNPREGERILGEYYTSTETETLTLVSCYPYLTNAERIVIVAEPVANGQKP